MPSVDKHYSQSLQPDEILKRLNEAYPDGPNVYQLAPIDQLHIGGIKASEKLAQRLSEFKASKVLDIGSGVGGLLRVCSQQHEAIYVSLDITHELSCINQHLNKLSKTNCPSMVVTGNGQQLPFPNQSFDLIIMQHSLLNMPDKRAVLNECKRILSPDGHLILHEVLTGKNSDKMLFPVPWASTSDLSHLISSAEISALISSVSMKVESMQDWSAEALSWRSRQTSKQQTLHAPVVTPGMILGSDFALMGKNVQRNLEKSAIEIVEIVIS
ncbi:class I SAM-dependent methyltransferase [Neptunomonas sp.]|uniref:class I SAM-dependent methyltransferase n=1 Tax=Neptunomonas sp. TaxID=1971898 RepID=UPI00356AE1A3